MKLLRRIVSGYKKTIKFRLTIFFILPILPLTFVSLYAVSQSEKVVIEQAGERTRAAMLSSLGYIDQFMNNIEQLSLLLSNDTYINDILNQPQDSEAGMIYRAMKLWDYLSDYKSVNDYMSDIWVLQANMDMIISRNTGGTRVDYKDRDWYQKTIRGQGIPILYNPAETRFVSRGRPHPVENKDVILVTRQMGFNSNQMSKHIVGIAIERKTLIQLCKGLLTASNSEFFLIGPDHQIIASNTGQQTLPFYIPYNNQSYVEKNQTKNDHNFFVTNVISEKSGWSMVLAQPESILNQDSITLQKFIYLLIILSFVLTLFISWIVYIGISAPLSTLLKGIYQIRSGKLDVRLKHNRKDEFGVLTDSFNQMAMQQKQYIHDIYEQQVQKSRIELKFLQSQINPHFLYNTLDSIYTSAINYDAEDISDMVLYLSKFFRLSLSKGKDTFSVLETIEHLSYYVRIQQLRFMDHFTWECHIAEDCKSIPILKLLLQPLVENAIIHGLEKAAPGGKLIVTATIKQDLLVFKVRDTGAGIPENRLRQIQHELEQIKLNSLILLNETQTSDFFGLKNVCSRLKLYYGDQADLYIDSKEGEGTEATVVIPTGRADQIPNEMKRGEAI